MVPEVKIMLKSYKYRVIYDKLKQDIMSQNYSSNEKLPSKRQLAMDYNVSINTVKNAYEQLIAEGYIYTQERQGYFVESLNKLIIQQDSTINGGSALETIDLPFRYSFSHMATDNALFPIDVWSKRLKEAFNLFNKELSEMPDFKGPLELRQSIAQLISYKRGVTCHPEQIIVSSGTTHLLRSLLSLFDQPMRVGIEDPGYARFRQLCLDMNQHVVNIPLDDKGLSIYHLKQQKPDFVITTPSHQFPTGTIMPISRRIELLNWVTEQQRYIIEDDYDSEFKYGTDNIPSLYSLDKNNRVIYLGTFSKTLMPSLRISYMVLPNSLLQEYDKLTERQISDLSSLNAYTLHLFIKSGDYEKYIRKMHHIYSEKHHLFINSLNQTFGDDITIYDMKAGLHFLVKIKTSLSYEEIEKRSKHHRLELYTIQRFTSQDNYYDNSNAKTFVIGIAKIKPEDIQPAIELFKSILI